MERARKTEHMGEVLRRSPTQPTPQTITPSSEHACQRCEDSGVTGLCLTGEHLARLPSGWYICPCGAGRRAWDKFGRQQWAEQVGRLFGQARIPSRFAGLTLGTFPVEHPSQKRAKNAVKHFIKNGVAEEGKEGLLLMGPYGTGKTGLAVAVLKAWVRQGKVSIFSTVPDLLDVIYASLDRDAEVKHRKVLEMVMACGLLVLDDLGTEHPTSFVNTKLFQIVNARHDWMRATVFTTNLNKPDLRNWMGERTYERILEMASVIVMDGPNLRRCGTDARSVNFSQR